MALSKVDELIAWNRDKASAYADISRAHGRNADQTMMLYYSHMSEEHLRTAQELTRYKEVMERFKEVDPGLALHLETKVIT